MLLLLLTEESMQYNDLKNIIKEIDCGNTDENVIRFLFLKYAITLKNKELENNENYIKFKNDFSLDNFDYQNTYNLFLELERMYELNSGTLANQCVFIDKFLAYVSSEDKKTEFYSILKKIKPSKIMKYLAEEGYSNRITSDFRSYTGKNILNVAKGILNITKKDVFCDRFCGYFLSGNNNDSRVNIGIESDDNILSLATMIHIMLGNISFDDKKVFIYSEKELKSSKEKIKAEKVFSDGPLDRTVERDIVLNHLTRTYNFIQKDCIGVATVIGRILSYKSYWAERKEITESCLDAIVSLGGKGDFATSVPRYLIVMNKKEKKDTVLFIDGEKINDESKIIEVFNNRKEIPGASVLIKREDILKDSYCSWIFEKFIIVPEAQSNRNEEEIEKELNESYKELLRLLQDDLKNNKQ